MQTLPERLPSTVLLWWEELTASEVTRLLRQTLASQFHNPKIQRQSRVEMDWHSRKAAAQFVPALDRLQFAAREASHWRLSELHASLLVTEPLASWFNRLDNGRRNDRLIRRLLASGALPALIRRSALDDVTNGPITAQPLLARYVSRSSAINGSHLCGGLPRCRIGFGKGRY